MNRTILTACAALMVAQAVFAQQQTTPVAVSPHRADEWAATDGLGRTIAPGSYPAPRAGKYVGIFYFIWQGAHGYDKHAAGAPGGGVMAKSPGDTQSPYDITEMLKANPGNPKYGPVHAFHHWGEPYFGYYLPDDEWIIRKHAQMLTDAGVDVIIFDVTNGPIYLPQVTKVAETYRKLRAAGEAAPSIAFIVNSSPKQTVQNLYNEIYKKGLFSDLWFYWKGKPLLLCPPEAVTPEIGAFFNVRQSWAWSKGQEWFADGKDKWPWLDHTPQSYGWHESKDKPEQVSVAVAEHPVSNIGRSFHNGKQPKTPTTEKGLYFNEQWKRALEVDPEFVFVTGWNEWVAMRFTAGSAGQDFLGKKAKEGETFFVDLYDAEFSRDAEPANAVTQDHYYYQMVSFIRQYKGARQPQAATGKDKIRLDGAFADWATIKTRYTDDQGDVLHRNHPGWGRIQAYTNTTGRNDIIAAAVASDADNVYFYVQTAQDMTPRTGPDWMRLFIKVEGQEGPQWEGFGFHVAPSQQDAQVASLQRFAGGAWAEGGKVQCRQKGAEMEIAVPKKMLGIRGSKFGLQVKWADNFPLDAGAIGWLDKGDAAPNARFTWRYEHR